MIKKSKGTHRVSLFIEINATVYFDSFGIQYIPQKVKINQLLTFYYVGFYCIDFIQYMNAEKTLLDYTNLFSPNDSKKNDKIIYKYFKDKYGKSRVQMEKIDKRRNYLSE